MKKAPPILLLFCIIFVLLIFSFVPAFHQQIVEHTRIDKIGHFIGFFLLTWLIVSLIDISLGICIVILVFYAAASELGQAYLGFRNGELADFIADVIGIFSFVLVYWYRTVSKYK